MRLLDPYLQRGHSQLRKCHAESVLPVRAVAASQTCAPSEKAFSVLPICLTHSLWTLNMCEDAAWSNLRHQMGLGHNQVAARKHTRRTTLKNPTAEEVNACKHTMDTTRNSIMRTTLNWLFTKKSEPAACWGLFGTQHTQLKTI